MSTASRWLVIAVVLLAGVGIGQFLHIRSSQSSLELLREEIRAELAAERAAPGGPAVAEPAAAGDGVRAEPSAPRPGAAARTLLSETAHWIDADATDDRPYGFSAFVVLRRGGDILLERCDAPDYTTLEAEAEEQPYATPACRMLIEGRVQELAEGRVAYTTRDGTRHDLDLELTGSGDGERLVLEVGGIRHTLAPGQKNTLWEKLTALPSVQREREARWSEHARLRETSLRGASAAVEAVEP